MVDSSVIVTFSTSHTTHHFATPRWTFVPEQVSYCYGCNETTDSNVL